MATRAAAAFRRAIRSVMSVDETDFSDRDLLLRFVEKNDQEAFATLVGRHSGMVLGVCRRSLPVVQDAEDAAQATFLVLVREARRVRWRPSLAGYLYATARRVAHNARVAAQRRARREARAAVPEAVPPVDRMTVGELLAILDRELDRLSATYREPLVLCYLQGLTRDQAAARLGVPVPTLNTRIDRGRKKLHDALTKGGVALGAGLLTFAVTSPAGASPPRLVESILTAASGSPSAAVAELVKGAAVNGMINKGTLAVVAAVGFTMVGFGFVSGPAAVGPREKPKEKAQMPGPAAKDAAEKKPAVSERTITGLVFGADGRPVAAELVLLPAGGVPRVFGKAGTKGEFTVALPAGAEGHLLAWADGHGADAAVVWNRTPDRLAFNLPKDSVVRGRVLDLQGKPVAGAVVVPLNISAAGADRVDQFLKAWAGMHPQEEAFHETTQGDHVNVSFGPDPLKDGRRLLSATTDKDGNFAITGLGAERVVELLVSGPGMADTRALVVIRPDFDPDPINRAAVQARAGFMLAENGPVPSAARLFGPTPLLALAPEKPIRGVVTDAATGEPRAGVRVTFERLEEKGLFLPRPHAATTGPDGRFEIRGSRRYESYLIQTAADPKAGYEAVQVEAADTPGLEPIEVKLATPRVPGSADSKRRR